MVGYERDWFWWVFQAMNMSAQFSRRKSQILNARISNCDEANRQHIVDNGGTTLELLELPLNRQRIITSKVKMRVPVHPRSVF